jgi:MATE family multidrug resistance protein
MRRELWPLLRLAAPVVLAEIGWMAMGIVDTYMVGPLGPAAIGAAGMSSAIYFAVAVFGMGVMLGLDTLVSQSYGAGRLDDCVRWLQHGTCLTLIVAPILMLLSYAGIATIDAWGLNPEVRALAEPYLGILTLSTLPLLLYATFRRYLQGIHAVRSVMVALVTANLVNLAGNWLLIYGRLGFPSLGVAGSAWATGVARLYMAVFLLIAIAREHARRGQPRPALRFRVEPARIGSLLRLGVPAAGQTTLEVGVFAAVSALAGRLDSVSVGAHQLAINAASLAFMIPLGLSSAAAVRVGHAIGARDRRRAVHAGWVSLAAGAAFMAVIAALLLLAPEPMLWPFTSDERIIGTGVTLLAIAAAFQIFDGTQAIATGALRGIGDTRTPVVVNVVGHWVFGLPAGAALCFWGGWGVAGLWVGLSVGLVLVAIALLLVWARKATSLSLPARPR